MSHLILDSEYSFYKLSENEQNKLVGKVFKTRRWKIKSKKVIYLDEILNTLYFPVSLTKEAAYKNYNSKYGLIFVSEVHDKREDHPQWFRVGACSPDDLDIDLDFIGGEYCCLRWDIINFLKQVNKRNTTYERILQSIHDKFGGKLNQ